MPIKERRRYSLVILVQSAAMPRATPAAANADRMPRCQSRMVPPVSKVSALTVMDRQSDTYAIDGLAAPRHDVSGGRLVLRERGENGVWLQSVAVFGVYKRKSNTLLRVDDKGRGDGQRPRIVAVRVGQRVPE